MLRRPERKSALSLTSATRIREEASGAAGADLADVDALAFVVDRAPRRIKGVLPLGPGAGQFADARPLVKRQVHGAPAGGGGRPTPDGRSDACRKGTPAIMGRSAQQLHGDARSTREATTIEDTADAADRVVRLKS
jgi:hypothetical protein